MAPAVDQLDPDVLYSPEELAEPATALVAQMSLEEEPRCVDMYGP